MVAVWQIRPADTADKRRQVSGTLPDSVTKVCCESYGVGAGTRRAIGCAAHDVERDFCEHILCMMSKAMWRDIGADGQVIMIIINRYHVLQVY